MYIFECGQKGPNLWWCANNPVFKQIERQKSNLFLMTSYASIICVMPVRTKELNTDFSSNTIRYTYNVLKLLFKKQGIGWHIFTHFVKGLKKLSNLMHCLVSALKLRWFWRTSSNNKTLILRKSIAATSKGFES